ncbi:hypothetical protein N7528_010186 [Penicillium herquei]|nr:hypothetical protein N7528_010186 [Penicillium herquei]
MHAGNAARLEEGFQDAADRLKIPNRHDPGANVFKLVYDWLRDNSDWVVILDNLDDASFLHEPLCMEKEGRSVDRRSLSSFLPRGSNGTLIMTTRSKDATLRLVDNKNIIEVHPMDISDAVELVNNKMDPPVTGMDAQSLAEALGFMPLAIIQATSYISRQSQSYSVSQYLAEFERNEGRKSKLLGYEAGHSQRDRDANNSILITWRISFEQVRKINSSAADLLSLMSFFDPHGISEDLLQTSIKNSGKSKDSGHDCETSNSSDSDSSNESDFDSTLQFRDAIATLQDYSFISAREDGPDSQVFSMHPLVQLAARQWLKTHNESEKWRDEFISILSARFPTGNFENWNQCQALFAHVKSACAKKPRSKRSLKRWGRLLRRASHYIIKRGIITQSDTTEMAEQSLRALRKTLGREHTSTINSMAFLASRYRSQGRSDEAEALGIEVLNLRMKASGEEHSSTINSMGSLALTYRTRGRLQEAEALGTQTLNLYKKTLGEEDPGTLLTMSSLAATYMEQGRFQEAEELETRALNLYKKVMGEEHPYTIRSMRELATIYLDQDRLQEAETLYIQVVDLSRKVLGEDNTRTISHMDSLAVTYRKQGQLKDAERLEIQVLAHDIKVFGYDDPNTLFTMENLALTKKELGRVGEARELLQDCVAKWNLFFGPEHPHTVVASERLLSWENEEMSADED